MSAYIVGDIRVTNPKAYAEYARQVPATLEQWGGRFLVRGGRITGLDGDWEPQRVVVLEFTDNDSLQGWYNSPEYRRIKPIRLHNSTGGIVMVEGVQPA